MTYFKFYLFWAKLFTRYGNKFIFVIVIMSLTQYCLIINRFTQNTLRLFNSNA